MKPMANPTYTLHCSEIWGGNHNVDCDVCTKGITASIYSSASDGSQGGDIYYFTVCSNQFLTRIILADLRGHGEQVSQLSNWIYEAMRAGMETLDGAGILKSLNQTLHERGFQAITTAVVAAFYTVTAKLYLSYAGHPPALLRKRDGQCWRPLPIASAHDKANLPLGVFEQTDYDQESMSLQPGDRIAIYTDGITECFSETDEEFGEERLCALLENSSNEEISAQAKIDGSINQSCWLPCQT